MARRRAWPARRRPPARAARHTERHARARAETGRSWTYPLPDASRRAPVCTLSGPGNRIQTTICAHHPMRRLGARHGPPRDRLPDPVAMPLAGGDDRHRRQQQARRRRGHPFWCDLIDPYAREHAQGCSGRDHLAGGRELEGRARPRGVALPGQRLHHRPFHRHRPARKAARREVRGEEARRRNQIWGGFRWGCAGSYATSLHNVAQSHCATKFGYV